MTLQRLTVLLLLQTVFVWAQSSTTSVDDDSLETGVQIGRGTVGMRLSVSLPTSLQLLRITGGYSIPVVNAAPRFSPALITELDFGNLTAHRLRRDTSVAALDGSNITVGALVPSAAVSDSSRVAVEGWRIGFRFASGHRLSNDGHSGFHLLHSGGWTWSFVRPGTLPSGGDSIANASAHGTADAYRSSHFGANTSATIGYTIGGIVAIEASYQRVLLYKNHVFFPWLGSLMLEGLAQTILKTALSHRMKQNPRATAIATFVLQSALSWGIYQLRSTSGQHFPFAGNTPLSWNEFRMSIGIQF
ncbi:MAG: hypothetical protein N2663_05115 [Chlorobi bacterium]|nr:hypothetical protein [Chlorobiota bacterium]